ncbi:NTP transferase domain-containing protein [Sphingomonas sp. SORGH_AS_0438]|uniref:NTP transferase domain-containing protein n=1 Tax=Sphingomonas sp. SORGH_AS_0438 TaxID=3041756 RepID=UPI003869730E
MTWSALILAGSRPGTTDPVATYAGVSHKALIRLEGATLLDRVAAAVRAAGATRVAVSASDRAVVVEAMRLGLEVLPPAAGPSASVAAALTVLGTPLLVTTADHALLDGAWIARFLADVPAEADVATLLARRDVVEAVGPRDPAHLAALRRWRLVGVQPVLARHAGSRAGDRPVEPGGSGPQAAMADRLAAGATAAAALSVRPVDAGGGGAASRPAGGRGDGGGAEPVRPGRDRCRQARRSRSGPHAHRLLNLRKAIHDPIAPPCRDHLFRL